MRAKPLFEKELAQRPRRKKEMEEGGNEGGGGGGGSGENATDGRARRGGTRRCQGGRMNAIYVIPFASIGKGRRSIGGAMRGPAIFLFKGWVFQCRLFAHSWKYSTS